MNHLHGNMHVFVLSCLILHERTKTCMFLCNFSPFSAAFYPSYIIMVEGLFVSLKYNFSIVRIVSESKMQFANSKCCSPTKNKWSAYWVERT